MIHETLTRPAVQANLKDKITEARQQQLLLSASDLYDLGVRYSRAQLHKMVLSGAFPRPIKISTQRSAWVASEIEAWLATRMAERAA